MVKYLKSMHSSFLMWVLCSVSDLKPRKDGKQKATWDTCNPSCLPQESNTCCCLKNFCGQLIKSKHKTPKTKHIKYLVFILMRLNCTILFWHSLVNNTAKIPSKRQYCVKFSSYIWNLKIMISGWMWSLVESSEVEIKSLVQMCFLLCCS